MKKPTKSSSRKATAAGKGRAKSKTSPAKKSAARKKAANKKPAAKKPAPKKAPAKKAAARKRAPARTAPESPSRKALSLITGSLDDDQAEDVVVIDLAGKSAMADFLVVASGRNPRHIGAMAQHLRDKIKAQAGVSPPVEGLNSAEWVLVDQGDVVVHLFRPETRKLYNLEKMWGGTVAAEGEDADPRRL